MEQQAVVVDRLQDALDQWLAAVEKLFIQDRPAGDIGVELPCAEVALLPPAEDEQSDRAQPERCAGGGEEPRRKKPGPLIDHRILAARAQSVAVRRNNRQGRGAGSQAVPGAELGNEVLPDS